MTYIYISRVWMKGFLPSQWYVPVSTLLPVSKVLSFSPPQRSWFPNRIPGKFFHVRRISQGQVFSHSEGSRSRLQKKKSRRHTHTPGKNTCDQTLQICIKHAMCFSQWYVPVLFIFILFFLPGGPVEEPLKPFCSFVFLFVFFRRPSCFNGDP